MAEEKKSKYPVLREKIITELTNSLSKYSAENPTDIDEIIYGLLDAIDGIKDNNELVKFLRVQSPYISRMVENENTPTLSKTIHTDPDWKSNGLDFAGISGNKNILDEYLNVPWSDIEYYAAQAEMDPKEFMKKLYEEGHKRDLYKIAHGEDLGGWFESPASFANNLGGATMSMFRPRAQESLEAGREPSTKDNVLDATQNLLYALPYGNMVLPGVKAGVPAAVKALGLNAVNPFAMEGLDMVSYDEDENKDRSDFSLSDALIGTGINQFTPFWLGRRIQGAKRMLGKEGGKATSDVVKQASRPVEGTLQNDMNDREVAAKLWKKLDKKVKENGIEALTAEEKKAYEVFAPIKKGDTQTMNAINSSAKDMLSYEKGNTFENTLAWVQDHVGSAKTMIKQYGSKEKALASIMETDPNNYFLYKEIFNAVDNPKYMAELAKKLSGPNAEILNNSIYKGLDNKYIGKFDRVGSEIGSNQGTNYAGDLNAEKLPVIGDIIRKRREENDAEEAKKAKEEAYKKYGINFMLGGY